MDFKHIFDFSTDKYTNNFVTYLGRIIILIIPGMIIGHYIDQFIFRYQMRNKHDTKLSRLYFVGLQLLIVSVVIYLFHIYISKDYAHEFQNTVPGLFFISLFFNTQTNLIRNIKKFLGG